MKYMLLIHHGQAPTPDDPDAWASLSEEEQKARWSPWPGPPSTGRASRPAARLGGAVEVRPLVEH